MNSTNECRNNGRSESNHRKTASSFQPYNEVLGLIDVVLRLESSELEETLLSVITGAYPSKLAKSTFPALFIGSVTGFPSS